MTKKISIWLAIFLVIFAMVITFQLTIIFGDVFFLDEPGRAGVHRLYREDRGADRAG